MKWLFLSRAAMAWAFTLLLVFSAYAEQANTGGAATIVSANGVLNIKRAGQQDWERWSDAAPLREGSRLSIGSDGFATLSLADGSILRLSANTELLFVRLPKGKSKNENATVIRLDRGRVDAKVQPKRARGQFEIETQQAVAGVRGTDFGVTIGENNQFSSDVTEGKVSITSRKSGKSTLLGPRQGAYFDVNEHLRNVNALPPLRDLSLAPLLARDRSLLALDYSPIKGAQAYQFRVAQDENFVNVVRNAVFPTPNALFANVPDGDYFVSVRPIDAYGVQGSQVVQGLQVRARPEPPVLMKPAQPAPTAQTIPLACAGSEKAISYRVQLASDVEFSHLLLEESKLRHCLVNAPLMPGAKLYWRASVTEGDIDLGGGRRARSRSYWSPTVVLTRTSPDALGFSPLIATSKGDLVLGYRIQVSANESFEPLLRDSVESQLNVDLDLPDGKYFMRWQLVLKDGTRGAFSTPQAIGAAAN